MVCRSSIVTLSAGSCSNESRSQHPAAERIHAPRAPPPIVHPLITTIPPCHQRRALLAAALTLPPLTLAPRAALADTILQDTTRRFLRPDVQPPEAVLKLLNARAALREMKVQWCTRKTPLLTRRCHQQALAATPADSEERFRARSRLPTFAKYLREVGPATPVVAGLVTGDKEGSLTEAYGGTGDTGKSIAVPIYESVGRVRVGRWCCSQRSFDIVLQLLNRSCR